MEKNGYHKVFADGILVEEGIWRGSKLIEGVGC